MNSFRINLRPICAHCSCEMTCVSNGVYVKLKGSHAFVSGDLYKCPECKSKIVTGFADEAFGWDGNPGLIVAEINL